MCHTGGAGAILRKYAEIWAISTDHFDPYGRQRGSRHPVRPLAAVLVEGSTYSRGNLKERLFRDGLKHRRCELCGQGEEWMGRPMSLILDHVNGVGNDNRLENLRIVCPNCAATLDTHCGRVSREERRRTCDHCREEFSAKFLQQRFCSTYCGTKYDRGIPRPETRKVDRPPYARLKREVAAMGWSAVGRRYGVSDNAVRKWVRWYEDEAARVSEAEPPGHAA